MKSKFLSLLMCCFAPLFLCAAESTVKDDKIPYDLHDEHDKTDIYAIQLDSSEEELDEEEGQLEDLQAQEQIKKI